MSFGKKPAPDRAWVFVPLAALAMVATLPGRSIGLGMITDPLIAELGVERTHYNLLNFWGTLAGALAALGSGALIDRFGIRGVIASVTLLLGLSVLGMAYTVTAGSLLAFLILARGSGQSALSAASVTLLGKWFEKKLPTAMGAFAALVAIGFAAAIYTTKEHVNTAGWRQTWTLIGYGVVGVSALLFLLARNRIGGGAVAQADPTDSDSSSSASFAEALATLSFWVIALGNALYYLVFSGASLNLEDIFRQLGFDAKVTGQALAALAGCGLLGNALASWAIRRIGLGRVLAATLAILAIVMATYGKLTTPALAITHSAMNGFCGGVFVVIFFSGFAAVFGRRDLGKIQGAAQALGVLASASGGLVLSQVNASAGSYFPAFLALAPLFGILAIIAWFAPGLRIAKG